MDAWILARSITILCVVIIQQIPFAPPKESAGSNRQARPGWVCPNGNTFDMCSHECKWITFKDGKIDIDRERKCGPEIAEHSPQGRQILARVDKAYKDAANRCSAGGSDKAGRPAPKDEASMLAARTPCNYFAGMMMRDVYGVNDFIKPGGIFMDAKEMNDFLSKSAVTDGLWERTDGGYANIYANTGRPVVASTPGHVGVVVPGSFGYSYHWNSPVPVVYSMSLDDPAIGNNPLRCMPCFANQIFDNRGPQPEYFFRTK